MPYTPRYAGNNPYGPEITFRTEDVLPPTALYLSMNDTPIAQFFTVQTGLIFYLSMRMLMPDGTIQIDNYSTTSIFLTPNNYAIIVPPVEGYLLSCVASFSGILYASCWCNIVLYKGAQTVPLNVLPPIAGMVIVQGYLQLNSFLSWPNSPVVEAGDGAGAMRGITLNVSPGLNWILQPLAYLRWRVASIQFVLTTSATATSRLVTLLLTDHSSNGLGRFPSIFVQAASLTYVYFFYPGALHQLTSAYNIVTAPIPDNLILDPGMALQAFTPGLDPGDTFTNIGAQVQEWMGVGV